MNVEVTTDATLAEQHASPAHYVDVAARALGEQPRDNWVENDYAGYLRDEVVEPMSFDLWLCTQTPEYRVTHKADIAELAAVAARGRAAADGHPLTAGGRDPRQPMNPWPSRRLPTFQDMRRQALKMLGDALDVMRSDWADGHGPTDAQASAFAAARASIGEAKAALDRAAP